MFEQAQNIGYFLLLLGVLVVVHELGHFIVAKLMNVKVLRFSVGFGPQIVGFTRGETEYRISWIPLGGYVKMAGELPHDETAPEDAKRGFLAQPPWKRVLIVAAGPAFNLAFPVLVFFCIYFFGLREMVSTRLGAIDPDLPAAAAGLRPGDRIHSVDGRQVRSFEELRERLRDVYDRPVTITFERGGQLITTQLTPQKDTESGPTRTQQRGVIGIYATPLPPIVGVTSGSVADAAGLRTFDRILSINGKLVRDSLQLNDVVKDEAGTLDIKVARTRQIPLPGLNIQSPSLHDIHLARQPGGGFAAVGAESSELFVGDLLPGSAAEKIGLRRGDRLLTLDGKPIRGRDSFRLAMERARDSGVELTWRSGTEVKRETVRQSNVEIHDELGRKVQVVTFGVVLGLNADSAIYDAPPPERTRYRLSVVDSLRESFRIVPTVIAETATNFAYLISGKVPLEMVGGPIAIYQIAKHSAAAGLDKYLINMATLSVNLGLVNLFPIPILDGFGLLAAAWEAVRRRPIPMRAREIANVIGLAMLFILMVIAFRNDIMR